MNRRHFLTEALRGIAAPLMGGYRLLTVFSNEGHEEEALERVCLGDISSFVPGLEKAVPPHLVVLSDERGVRARLSTAQAPQYCPLSIKNGNQLWVNLVERVPEAAYLCHMTLEMKE